jgi:diacylglycerol kinase (ATP)
MRVTLVHNPTAGDETHNAESLRAAIEVHGHRVRYVSVKDDDWQRVFQKPADLVVAAGGDGTVRKVFKEVADRPAPVTLLPLGTANNIAAALGFETDDPFALVESWSSGATRPYDSGRVTAGWGAAPFFEALGGGTFAELLALAEAEKKKGKREDKVEKGLRLLSALLPTQTPQEWDVELDDRAFRGDYVGVEVMNTPQTGPSIPLAPRADLGDGRFDVVLIDGERADALEGYVEDRRTGRGTSPPAFEIHKTRRVRLVPPEGTRLRVDDELWPEKGEHSGGVVTAMPGPQLDVLVPARRAAAA